MKLRGFTLFELLFSIGIALILLVSAVPAYQQLIAHNKTMSVVNHITFGIHTARSAAIAQNQVVDFCGSQDRRHCDGEWSQGQVMLLDQTQEVLQRYDGLTKGDRLWWNSSLGYDDTLKFAPTGFTNGQRGSFYYCPQRKPEKYGAKIIVSESGRVRVEYNAEELSKTCV